MPSRRRVLATVAAGLCGALAGCADPAGVLQMRPATDETILEETTLRIRPESDAEERDILDDLAENESVTVEGTRPPLRVEQPVAFGDRLYDVSRTETGERTRTDYLIELDFDPEDASGTEMALEELPDVDRDVLESLLRLGTPSDEGIDVGTSHHFADDELEASVLVPEQEVEIVVANGDPVRVHTEPTETMVTEYRYTATERDETVESYVEDVRSTYRFVLEGLTDDERAVVEEAIDERGYYASSTDDEAFEGVARTFLEHDPVTSDGYEGGWLVEYDGETYWAQLDLLQFRELQDRLEETT